MPDENDFKSCVDIKLEIEFTCWTVFIVSTGCNATVAVGYAHHLSGSHMQDTGTPAMLATAPDSARSPIVS